MTGQALRLGPFTGGLNLQSDPVVVEDTEVIEALNVELDIDGSMVARPAYSVVQQGGVDDRLFIFGSVHFSGVYYLFATRSGATFVSDDLGSTWTELNPGSTSRECVTMQVYKNTVWMPATPGSVGGGISWTPSGGASAVAAMPRATASVVHKNRLYLCPGPDASTDESRLHFSDAADFTSWPGANFLDVAQGDGDSLNAVIVFQDNLLLFKNNSTHYLAYDLDPSDAILREVNPVVGVDGAFSVVQHENTVYTIKRGMVFEVVNLDFNLINIKVPFVFDNSLPVNTDARYENEHISLLGDRLVCRYFNRTYIFGLRTRTWSEWRKTDGTSTVEWHIHGPLIKVPGTQKDDFYTAYSFDMTDASGYKIIKIHDGSTVTDFEGFGTNTFDCIVTTKDYDMADPVRFKRLFWWSADVLTGNTIVADVQPIVVGSAPLWSELESTTTWEDLKTWESPLLTPTVTQTTVVGDNNFLLSKAIKFKKSLRFRKVNFSVKLVTDGTSSQPAKIFSYIAIVKTKQNIVAQVS